MAEKMTVYLEDDLANKIDKESKKNKRTRNNMFNYILFDYFQPKNENEKRKNEDDRKMNGNKNN